MSKQRSLSEKWNVKLKPSEAKRLKFVKDNFKGFNLKKRFSYTQLVDKTIILSVNEDVIHNVQNLAFDIVYYPNSKTFLIQLNVNGQVLFAYENNNRFTSRNHIAATVMELVDFKKSGVTEITCDADGKTLCTFHCGNFCVFLRDIFLGVICPKCAIKYDSRCKNCDGTGLIPEDVQVCFKCYGTSVYPRGTKTACTLCKAKGFLDPSWNKCETCSGLGSKLQKDQGGSFVYPCDSCHSLGYFIGEKVKKGIQDSQSSEPKKVENIVIETVVIDDNIEDDPQVQSEMVAIVLPPGTTKVEPEPEPILSVPPIEEAPVQFLGQSPIVTTPSLLQIKIEQTDNHTLLINGVVHEIRTPAPESTPQPDPNPQDVPPPLEAPKLENPFE